jgi:hypothetical protein
VKRRSTFGNRTRDSRAAGGSLASAYVEAGIGFGYVMNRMWPTLDDPRATIIADAVRDCL